MEVIIKDMIESWMRFHFNTYTGRKITFDSFNLDFYDGFVDFLTYEYQSYRYSRSELSIDKLTLND